jgi:hypothetical protein
VKSQAILMSQKINFPLSDVVENDRDFISFEETISNDSDSILRESNLAYRLSELGWKAQFQKHPQEKVNHLDVFRFCVINDEHAFTKFDPKG